MEEDPALQFFPDGNVDLYAVLEVAPSATDEEIRKAYRRRALRLHPDKLVSSGLKQDEASAQFQQLGFAYGVLSDPSRRKRYDDTGRTDESLFTEEEFNWPEYFRELWNSVCGEKLNEFKAQYVGSEEEKQDIYEAYHQGQGSLEHILNAVPCAQVLEDEGRFITVIEDAIKAGELERLGGWTSSVSDTKARTKMRNNARKEAMEAEAHAKELGVWEELFGDGKKRPRRSSKADAAKEEDEEDEEDEPPVKSKRARSTDSTSKKAASAKGKSKGKKEAQGANEDDQEDLGGLAALIQKRQESRSGIGGLIARLEEQANAEADARYSARGGKGKRECRDPLGGERLDPGEPNEEEFLAAQQRLTDTAGSTKGKGTTKTKGKKGR